MHRSFEDYRPSHAFAPRGERRRTAIASATGVWLVALCAGAMADGGDLPTPAAAGLDAWPAPGEPWPASLDAAVTLAAEVDPEHPVGVPGLSRRAAGEPTLGAASGAASYVPGADDTGACFAEVNVPARYRLEPVDVVLREAGERFEVEPARLVAAEREIVVRDGHTRIVAVQPEMRTERERIEHRAASSRLVRGTLDGELPASPAELEAVAASGIDTDALPAGTCVNEWYEAPVATTGERRVPVREASETLAVEPAAFEDVSLPVEVRPAYARLVEIPATWRGVERKVMIEPASTAWVRGEGPIQRFDEATGEIMCRVDVPAKHETLAGAAVEVPAMVTTIVQDAVVEDVDVARLATDARELRTSVPAAFEVLEVPGPAAGEGDWTWLIGDARPLDSAHERTGRAVCRAEVPAVTVSWEREVLVAPGRFEREIVSAETIRMPVEELVADATSRTVPVPAETVRLTRRTALNEASVEWRPVLCRTNVTPDVVRRLQLALDDAGHSPNGIDGLLGPGTRRALEDYQTERGLPTGGLTLETVESLGVALHAGTVADAER